MNGSGDMEAASASGGGMVGGDEDEVVYLDPFNIATTKNASVETLKRWRVGDNNEESITIGQNQKTHAEILLNAG